MKGLNEIGACRLCVVDTGARALQAACVLPASEGMNVKTNTPAVRNARKMNLELLLSNHDKKCLSCVRSTTCELQKLCNEYGVEDENRYAGSLTETQIDDKSPAIVRNNAKCVLCRRCVACATRCRTWASSARSSAASTPRSPAPGAIPSPTPPASTAASASPCAPPERSPSTTIPTRSTPALADPTKHVVVQPAPAVRAALGEEFGIPMGTSVTGKMACALRRLGFDKVFDTDFAADLTIMEEANELIDRVKNGGVFADDHLLLPRLDQVLRASVSGLFANLSSCKSPHEMEGAVIKSYYAEKAGIDPKDIVTVSVMPCTARSSRPPVRVGPRRHGGCGHRHHHARVGADDQEVRHRLCQPARGGL